MNTQTARGQYREHIGGFYTSGTKRGKPYLRNGWTWPRVRFYAGGPYTNGYVDLPVHPAAVEGMQAIAAVLFHHRYDFRETAGGTVNMRNITGASTTAIERQIREQYPWATSLHAHGVALDINPSKNAYGSSKPDELDQAQWARLIFDLKHIRQVDGLIVVRWGGDWSNDDDMHIEPTGCTRAQLARGIKLSTIPGWDSYRNWANTGAAPPTQGDEDMLIKKDDPKSIECAEVQKVYAERFNQSNGTWPPFSGRSIYDGEAFGAGEDGSPGPTFEANTKKVQGLLGQPQTGVVDSRMYDALMFHAYGAQSGGVTVAQVDEKIAIHAKQRASATVHPHGGHVAEVGGPQ